MGKKLGALIKSARTGAGYTPVQLARKITGVSASDISAFERGVAEPTQQMVKDIAKATGVTQKSLLDAMPKSASASKTSTAKKTSTASKSSMQVTAAERRLVELYRAADSDTKKAVLKQLRGTDDDLLDGIDFEDIVEGIGNLLFKK